MQGIFQEKLALALSWSCTDTACSTVCICRKRICSVWWRMADAAGYFIGCRNGKGSQGSVSRNAVLYGGCRWSRK